MTQAVDSFDTAFDTGRAKAFAAADRHTARVRLLKRAIVLAAVLGVAALFAVTWFDPFRRLPENVSIGSIGVNGSRVTMELPKLSGFRRDAKPYDVSARSAIQDLKKPNMIELVELDARIAMSDQSTAHVTAHTGYYDSVKETMDLRKDVRMKTDAGHEVQLNSALIDFKAGTLLSSEPVTALMRNSTVKSDSMRVGEGGKVLVFEGRVRTTILPDDEQDAAAAQLKGTSQ